MRGLTRGVLPIVLATALLTTACGDNSNGSVDIRRSLTALTDAGVPGALALVNLDDEITTVAVGSSSAAVFSPMTPGANTRIASVSKAFNGAAVLQLVNRGDLQLSTTIGEVLPTLPADWHPVTVTELLQHTSGVPDYIGSEAFLEDFVADPQMQRTPEQLLDYVAGQPLEFAPGSAYSYSDSDNIVAGLIVEQVTGTPYRQALSDLVLEPWDLLATTLPDESQLPAPAVLGYAEAEDDSEPPTATATPSGVPLVDVTNLINPDLAWASGGMISTAADLDRFMRRYASGSDITAELREAQRQFVPGESGPPGPGDNASGLALYRYSTSCGDVLGHTGNMPGYTIFAAATGDGARSAVVVINRQANPNGDAELYELFDIAAETAACAGSIT